MTVIVAKTDGNYAAIGSDTFSVAGNDIVSKTTQKWLISGRKALGLAGWHRTNYLVSREWDRIARETDTVDEVCDRILMLMEQHKYRPDDQGGPVSHDFSAVYADGPLLWEVFPCMTPYPRTFATAGCGEDYAKGAAFGQDNVLKAVKLAVEAACCYDHRCGGLWLAEFRDGGWHEVSE